MFLDILKLRFSDKIAFALLTRFINFIAWVKTVFTLSWLGQISAPLKQWTEIENGFGLVAFAFTSSNRVAVRPVAYAPSRPAGDDATAHA